MMQALRWLCLGLSIAGLLACGAERPDGDQEGPLGRVRVALTSTGPDGATYRLRSGVLDVTGAASATINTEDDLTATIRSVDLPAGAYQVQLQPGWSLERSGDGGMTFATIGATLLSANPQAFSIVATQATDVAFRLGIDAGVIDLGPGTLNVSLQVEFADCDPVAQTGCLAGQKCTSVDLGMGSFATGCYTAGATPVGGACSSAMGGSADTCAAGSFCIDGTCSEICDTSMPPSGCNCLQYVGIFADRTNVGVCGLICDPLAQDCPDQADECVVQFYNPPLCAQAGTAVQGDACMYLNSCQIGYSCTLSDDPVNPTGLTCAFICDPSGGGPSCDQGPGAGYTCVSLSSFYSDPAMPSNIGHCVDCTVWGC